MFEALDDWVKGCVWLVDSKGSEERLKVRGKDTRRCNRKKGGYVSHCFVFLTVMNE